MTHACGTAPTSRSSLLIARIGRLLHRIEKFFDLPANRQRQMLHALLLVIAFRIGLWTISYRFLQRIADRVRARRIAPAEQALCIGQNVTAMSGYIPGASCLTQALATQVLLQRDGFSPLMRIGVARGDGGEFKAHAWIECDGKIIVGDLGPQMKFAMMRQV